MSGERTALNFLQTLSATATQTARLLAEISHTAATLLDTRKTLPGMRAAQKYAVRCAGAKNHRMGLYDAYLIKENHIASCGGIAEAISSARLLTPGKTVEIEVRDLEELEIALQAEADIIMLDNFSLPGLAAAVNLNARRAKLEASGGIETGQLVKIAETGVDYISVGAITKHCRAIDLSLLIDS
jgi:nicotinate-nucleotide pyrophosphorylase (carboxylating)